MRSMLPYKFTIHYTHPWDAKTPPYCSWWAGFSRRSRPSPKRPFSARPPGPAASHRGKCVGKCSRDWRISWGAARTVATNATSVAISIAESPMPRRTKVVWCQSGANCSRSAGRRPMLKGEPEWSTKELLDEIKAEAVSGTIPVTSIMMPAFSCLARQAIECE